MEMKTKILDRKHMIIPDFILFLLFCVFLFIKVFNFFQAFSSCREITNGLKRSVGEIHNSFRHLSSGSVVVITLITGFLVL